MSKLNILTAREIFEAERDSYPILLSIHRRLNNRFVIFHTITQKRGMLHYVLFELKEIIIKTLLAVAGPFERITNSFRRLKITFSYIKTIRNYINER